MRRRALIVVVLLLSVWAALVSVTGGVSGELFGVKMSLRSVWRPAVLAAVLFGAVVVAYGWRSLDAGIEWRLDAIRPAIGPAVGAFSIGIVCLGLFRGIVTAAGADSYGYLSQADLWLSHHLRIEQPFVEKLPLPNADWTFSPLGYRPAAAGHVIVPTYAPGLPILMAIVKSIAGPRGPFVVVPVLGGLTVWLTYLLGVRAGSPSAGAVAAALVASSPAFLFQLMWPMSDIPAAAFWTAALVAALGTGRYAPAISGACASVAVAIRPNLVPLAAIPFAYLIWKGRGGFAFAVAALPGVCLVAAVNAYLYGSPLASGYGNFDALYKLGNAPANITRYAGWLLTTQTPLVALAIVALARPPRAVHGFLAVFAAGVFIGYVFYTPFDAWWYLRFLLPGLPALLVLMAVGLVWVVNRLPALAQTFVVSCGAILLIGYGVNFAVSQGVFELRDGERRYETIGRYAASSTPPNAVFLSMQHSGGIRYYSNRLTLRYDWLPSDWLDRAIALLRDQGYRPYIVLEDWEEAVFKQRFGGQSETGRLAWRPLMEFNDGMPVRVYEPP